MTDTASAPVSSAAIDSAAMKLPRVVITFCTQCKWMLRAAYFAQELLSTFSLSLGEVSLAPSTGGIFTVELFHAAEQSTSNPGADQANGIHTNPLRSPDIAISRTLLWDRKKDGGFPETKELKRRVRNVIEPDRDLGHVDRDHGTGKQDAANSNANASEAGKGGDQDGEAANGDGKSENAAGESRQNKKRLGINQRQNDTVGRHSESSVAQEKCEDCS